MDSLCSRERTEGVRTRSRSRDVSPLSTLSSNQLHKLLGNGDATRKRSVSISGLRRSRTFTAADGARNRRIVPVLQSSSVVHRTSSATNDHASCPSSNCTECDSCPQPVRSSTFRSRATTKTTSGGRVAAAKTVGRTPPPLGRSVSVLHRKSSSVRRMNSLRVPSSEARAGGAAAACGAAEQFVPKLAIVGAEACGKSTLVTRWLKGSTPQSTFYEPTIEDRFQHATVINGREQMLEIIDTSGSDDFSEMRFQSLRSAHAIVLVYDITQPTSLSWLRQIFYDIQRIDEPSHVRPVIVMVGNKVDCHERRQVSSLDGAAMAKDLFQCEYLEASAVSGVHVDEVLRRVVKQLGKKASVLSKVSTNVSRSRSFLQRTVGVIRPKRRPKIPTEWDNSSGNIATLRPTQRGNVRMKSPTVPTTSSQAGESKV